MPKKVGGGGEVINFFPGGVVHGSLERSYIVRPGCDTEIISNQVGKVKKNNTG